MKDLYVSSVEGAAMARFSAMTRTQACVLIGAQRDLKNPKRITWNTEEVVCIPAREVAQFFREYTRAIKRGDLKERTKAEYDAWQKVLKARHEEQKAKAQAAREKAAAEAATAETELTVDEADIELPDETEVPPNDPTS